MKTSGMIGVAWYVLVLVGLIWQMSTSRSPSRWLLAVVGWAGYGVYLLVVGRKEKRESEKLAEWHRRLVAAVDVQDFEDDGHLHELFEPEERERLIQELERMPQGSRSLRRAIEIVSPELLNEGA